MKAWLLDSMDGIERLRLDEAPQPAPAAEEVVLQVHYAALNPADRYLAQGQYPAQPPLPHVLGRDGMGHVVEVGHGVKRWRVGDRAVVLRGLVGVERWGTFAERVAVPEACLVPVPQGWDEPQAAAAPLVYLTAHQALMQWGDLPTSVVLITGASGGVGVASLHLGRAIGHRIVALSRSAEKQKKLREMGTEIALDPNDPQWRKRLRELLEKRRVDLAIDNIGGNLFSEVIDTLGMWGKISVVGRLAGPVPQFNTASLFFRRIRIGGVALSTNTPEQSQAAWREVLSLLDKIKATPVVDRIFPFDELPVAFARLAEGPMGKVVVKNP